jgi:D-alanyl-D-alanine dipeptidase
MKMEREIMVQTHDPEHITLIADPKVISVSVHENGDPFIDLIDQVIIDFGPSPEIPNNTDYTKMRKTVYEKLVHAQELLPTGIRFCIYECYRSFELQTLLFKNRYNIVRDEHPNWSHEQIFIEATRLVSPMVNLDGSQNVPPHSTGGAVDLYLIDEKGEPLDMGIHPKDFMDNTDGTISQTDSTLISSQAQKNRHTMNKALEAVGFVNYPTEYWHWSYGDRYWAYMLGKPYAIYGSK